MVRRYGGAAVNAETAICGQHVALLEKLIGAVRPEFRADTLTFETSDPVFGGGACRVDGCDRSARGHGLCPGHLQRWTDEGRRDLDVFAGSTDPRWRRQQPNGKCRVEGCGYGTSRAGLCQLHAQRWLRCGRPDLTTWLADPPAIKQPESGARCLLEHCELWPQAATPFCHAHAATWRVHRRPEVDSFARGFVPVVRLADETIRFGQLEPQLRLEIQYALQCRRDERASKTQPGVVMLVVRFLTNITVTSLLARSEQQWRTELAHQRTAAAFLIYARRKVEDLADADGWEAEFPRDIWQLRRLGYHGNQTLTFTAIPQPWLGELGKRWLRWRLSTGLEVEVVRRGLRTLTRFSVFCADHGVNALADIDRTVLERYLADLHAELAGRQRHNDHIGQLNSFLQAIRQHHWDHTLPATALLFTDDYPKRSDRMPRALAEHVMAQVEHADNLNRWDNAGYRLVTVILIRCGLRVSDALNLSRECVVTDAEGAPYLRYVNHKMKREALVPIDEEVQAFIAEQQQRVGQAP